MGRLDGKSALVFGAGPNIGGTIAYFLAREGARVAVTDLEPSASAETAAFIKSRGFEATALSGNALSERDVEANVRGTVDAYGGIDIVVNMIGTIHWSSIVDMDVDKFQEALLSFPTAGMLTTKHAARAMIGSERPGSIIHILSTAAHFGEAAGAAYCASKAALLNLARSAAMDLAHDGIRVNTITPCAMEHQLWTKRSAELFDPDFVAPKTRSYRSRDEYLKQIPLERFPRSSDIASAAVFLASDEAAFLTGVDIPVDGGLRFKYPTWRPADYTGVNLVDYANSIYREEYGERTTPLFDAKESK
jgi:NAD(P)-dependent dehydrogenase (short-subunit alcohol dehydrogenase family)